MNFRHRIEIQEKVRVRDELGGIKQDAYRPWRKFWADIQDTGGGEGIRADASQRISETRTIFTVRNGLRGGVAGGQGRSISADMRIRYADQSYNIKNIQYLGADKRFITIEAQRDDSSR